MGRMVKTSILIILLVSCSGINQEHTYKRWPDLPKPVQEEFQKMLKDTTGAFMYCQAINKGQGCEYKSLYYTSRKFVFSNGSVDLVDDIYNSSLRWYVFYNDTLYSSIKKSMTGRQGRKSLEKIVTLDTLDYKLIWKD